VERRLQQPVLGMPHRLRDLEVLWEDFPEIGWLILQDDSGPNNPEPVNSRLEQVIEVLEKAC
jgi:alcohol dehydrogenase class IV